MIQLTIILRKFLVYSYIKNKLLSCTGLTRSNSKRLSELSKPPARRLRNGNESSDTETKIENQMVIRSNFKNRRNVSDLNFVVFIIYLFLYRTAFVLSFHAYLDSSG